jgi:hypothetical protein
MMSQIFALCFLAFAALPLAVSKPRALFDGKTFAGWEGNLKVFRIEGGAIVGGTLEAALPHNEFLCTPQRYSDFILRVKFKVLGERANAGVQFRSEPVEITSAVNRGAWGVYLSDPDGITLELRQPPAG